MVLRNEKLNVIFQVQKTIHSKHTYTAHIELQPHTCKILIKELVMQT